MKTKYLVLITYFLLAVGVMYAGALVETSLLGKTDKFAKPNNVNPPDLRLINDLDKVIQQRFLTAPNFGVRRIGPKP